MDELKVSQKELEVMSGISQQAWSKAFNGRQRMNSGHIEFLCSKYKDYAYWLTTGSTDLGLSPQGAKALEYFSKIAGKYAETKAEFDYALMIEQYLSDSNSIVDENGIAGSSPMPSDRKELAHQHLTEIMSVDFKKLTKKLNCLDANEIRDIVNNHFYRKACSDLVTLTQQYGKDHRLTVMLSRLLTEFLLPGSTSNALQPFKAQQSENGVDNASHVK